MDRRTALKILTAGLMIPLVPIKIAHAAKKSGRRLVLIELSGANDGLNTIIPNNDHRYRELRPNIGLDKSETISLSNDFGLHEAMKPMGRLWESGEMAVVHGLGYPGANRSHFKSIALWETGGDGTAAGRTGWLTEDVENMPGQEQLEAHGISLDGGMGIFSSPSGVWLSMTSAQQFMELTSDDVPNMKTENQALQMLLDRAHTLNSSMESISKKLKKSYAREFRIEGGDLGAQFSRAILLINAGINSPILKVKIGGFDTHEGQPWRHRNRLRNLARAIEGFSKALKQINQWDNTLIMTYSEFGRRAAENYTQGTDHGTAAPHFLLGGSVKGGFWGVHPDLGNLNDGDMVFTMDYRSVYERILGDWFMLKENKFFKFRNDKLKNIFRNT
tara:strand:+ start:567 stop:1733 length:1167 start_codon:yes stop_codon:yes gene_type:complete